MFKLQNKHLLILAILIGSLLIASYVYEGDEKPQIISNNPIHQHAHLLVTIKGEHVTIPAGIGLTRQVEHPDILHTHLEDNVIHMEMDPPVKSSQIMVGEFFKVWGKRFDKHCIFDNCEATLHFLVNGRVNNDFDKYVMRDGDEIEILLE